MKWNDHFCCHLAVNIRHKVRSVVWSHAVCMQSYVHFQLTLKAEVTRLRPKAIMQS